MWIHKINYEFTRIHSYMILAWQNLKNGAYQKKKKTGIRASNTDEGGGAEN